ncbi:BlaI/MecI/CopY family transcriptional regulator [Neolewinella aurantiaca]|uniref:BlaI/MecI/CopY family transcriptional regulator n=1 Tax=Neolewinella aurantiaca TaxID=2602767 RepID=A0A5C7FI28_9BACT|nr:BlaI/MecI/CopY family transcriptional regulator [Neolewinella aurantiaca]TXF90795.1 BlaI/MecI/CopY family transcriptional regulator [Neolewinella aurantiaca]
MEPLTRKEEEVLRILFKLEKAFVKEIIEAMPGKKPAYTTVSTVVRNLKDKGYVAIEDFGSTHRYYPAIPKEQFFGKDLKRVVSDFFDDSHKALVSHFAKNKKLSREDLEDILRMIDEQE